MQKTLPIWEIGDAIGDSLREGNRLVLVAPTGSGKSTQVPQLILDRNVMPDSGKRIVILQPRRVAARTLAARVAFERRCQLGAEVGYQIRFEDETSLGTRICFVTEGVLLRWLQDDPGLSNLGAILFDEFHERNLMSDVALGLVKKLQQTRRPDLKLAVMSATLEAEPVAAYLDDCPILRSEGRTHPVDILFSDHSDRRSQIDRAADAVATIVNNREPGDILVFMPGMGEIMATMQAIGHRRLKEPVDAIPLHGDLPPDQQDRAFLPSERRKVVVATNVAETSVTIDGVRFVVDSGLARMARFDADRGINTLFIEEISRASADQRAGRAGRTAPGQCHRLWNQSNHLNRPEKNTPEIQRTDLAETVLLLHSLGIRKAANFDWLDHPDPEAIQHAEDLLEMLGAIDTGATGGHRHGALTSEGRLMMKLPMHPRYSRMLVEAARLGCVEHAALWAALVSGRYLLVRMPRGDKRLKEKREDLTEDAASDFEALTRAYFLARENRFDLGFCREHGIHAQTARIVEQTFNQFLDLARRLRNQQRHGTSKAPSLPQDEALRRSVLAGFVDQLAKRRDRGTLECDLTLGRQGTLVRESALADEDSPALFVTASIREVAAKGGKNLTLLGLASAVDPAWLKEMFPQHVQEQAEHDYDRTHKRVQAVRRLRFLGMEIVSETVKDLDDAKAGLCLAHAFRDGLFELPNFDHGLRQFIGRVNLVAQVLPELEFPPFDEAAIRRCIGAGLKGITLAKQARDANLKPAIHAHLSPEQREWLDELAPLAVPFPDGKSRKLLYSEQATDNKGALQPPELQIKIHECFVLEEHPVICEGRLPIRIRLQKPNGKRLDETDDWPAFRNKDYPRHKRELQSKFQSVAWP